MKSLTQPAQLINTLRLPALVVWGMVLLMTSQFATASEPVLSYLRPIAATAGTETDLLFHGERLGDVLEIIAHDPGVEVLNFNVPDDKNGKEGKVVVAKVKISPTAAPGQYRFRVRTKTGMSSIEMFTVCTLPTVEEKEPNSEFDTPQAISINRTVIGRIDNEDADYYVVEAKKGDRLTAEVEGFRLGVKSSNQYFFDPFIAILNDKRFELGTCDDLPLCNKDGFVSVIVPEDGKYTVLVRDSSYKGDGNSYYCLHVGNFPRPSSVLPAGGKPGETLTVKMLGDVKGDLTQSITIPEDFRGRHFGIAAKDGELSAPTINQMKISPTAQFVEQEPNNAKEQANVITQLPIMLNGVIAEDGDLDLYKLKLLKDQDIDVECFARRLRSALDSVVEIWSADGKLLKAEDDKAGLDSIVRFKAPAEGEYIVVVRDHLRKGGAGHFYQVEVRSITPRLKVETAEVVQYIQPEVIVPQGKRMAYLVTVGRFDCGGPISFQGENLPAGVRLEMPEDWQNDGTVPLMLVAEENAELTSRLSKIDAMIMRKDQAPIQSILLQPYLRIRYNGNVRYLQEEMDRVAISVVENLPFDVEIVPVQAPVVRGGPKSLKVIAHKKEGWDEKINVRLLQNPPGVSSGTNVAIEKGKNEALIVINANGDAPVRESSVCVIASAPHAGAQAHCCSPFTKVKVAEQFLKVEFQPAATEQGQETPFVVKLTQETPYEGEAECVLEGLPHHATADPVKINKDAKEVIFNIKTQADTTEGNHKNLQLKITMSDKGETIEHRYGGGRLRIDKPAPPKATPAPTPQPQVAANTPAMPVEVKPPVAKPLSRLEKLRLEQEAKLKGETN
jgi:hypothetical protein